MQRSSVEKDDGLPLLHGVAHLGQNLGLVGREGVVGEVREGDDLELARACLAAVLARPDEELEDVEAQLRGAGLVHDKNVPEVRARRRRHVLSALRRARA